MERTFSWSGCVNVREGAGELRGMPKKSDKKEMLLVITVQTFLSCCALDYDIRSLPHLTLEDWIFDNDVLWSKVQFRLLR